LSLSHRRAGDREGRVNAPAGIVTETGERENGG
jgi:hypothetical protein